MLTRQPTRPKCDRCDISLAKPNGKSKHGFQKWHKYCVGCAKALYAKGFKHLQYKTTTCIECGFVPTDMIQLVIMYNDGDSKNKTPPNIKTVCLNCASLIKKRIDSVEKILDISVDSDFRI
jgi:hypothetical protein